MIEHRNLLIDQDQRNGVWYSDCLCGWISVAKCTRDGAANEFYIHAEDADLLARIGTSLS